MNTELKHKYHAATRPSGLRAIADGLPGCTTVDRIDVAVEALRVAADRMEEMQTVLDHMRPIVQAQIGKGPFTDKRWNLTAFSHDALYLDAHIFPNVQDQRPLAGKEAHE
jgi:hypothetical protein